MNACFKLFLVIPAVESQLFYHKSSCFPISFSPFLVSVLHHLVFSENSRIPLLLPAFLNFQPAAALSPFPRHYCCFVSPISLIDPALRSAASQSYHLRSAAVDGLTSREKVGRVGGMENATAFH